MGTGREARFVGPTPGAIWGNAGVNSFCRRCGLACEGVSISTGLVTTILTRDLAAAEFYRRFAKTKQPGFCGTEFRLWGDGSFLYFRPIAADYVRISTIGSHLFHPARRQSPLGIRTF